MSDATPTPSGLRPDELIQPDKAVLDAMARYGGSFASRLAVAWRCADPERHKVLLDGFGDLYDRYRGFVQDEATGREVDSLPAVDGAPQPSNGDPE